MNGKRNTGLFLALTLALANQAQPGSERARLPGLPLFPVPIVRKNVPLTKALSDVGVHVRGGYVLFGIEVRLRGGQEPAVDLNVQPGSTLEDALRQVFQQLQDYTFEVVSGHLIDVYPARARNDPRDVLNILLAGFDVDKEYPSNVLSRPADFIPLLKARLTPETMGLSGGGSIGPGLGVGPSPAPIVTLHLRNITVRQALNAVTEATEGFPPNLPPLGWVCSFRPDPTLPGGGAYSWSFHWSAPADWKKEAGKGERQSVE